VHFQEDTQSEILRCAQDDTRGEFFRSLLGMEFFPYFSFCCPKNRDHAYESSQVTSSTVLISLIGKR
jgi:hypothetical protein